MIIVLTKYHHALYFTVIMIYTSHESMDLTNNIWAPKITSCAVNGG